MRSVSVLFFTFIVVFSFFAFASGAKTYTLDKGTWKTVKESPTKTPLSSSNAATPMVYVYIQYTKVYAHVDVPGEWMFGNVRVTTIASNVSVTLNLSTSGNLKDGSNSIPTYYRVTSGEVPHSPFSSFQWKSADAFNGYQFLPSSSQNSMWLWVGVDIDEVAPKGRYTGWIEVSIAQKP